MRNETAYTRRKLWHIDAHRPRRNRSKKSARDTRLGRWTRTTRSMKRQITTATSDTKQKQKVTHDQRRKHGQTQANTFTHAHKPLLLSASEYRDRHGYESWTFWPWHWTYGSCRVKQERGVEHERHEGTEWGAECGTGKAGRIGGRLRHLAQACAPRVNTAGLAWPYGLTFAPPSPSPRPPPLAILSRSVLHDRQAPSCKIHPAPLLLSPAVNRWSLFFLHCTRIPIILQITL